MNNARKTEDNSSKEGVFNLGNLSLLIFLATLVSLFVFIQFNLNSTDSSANSSQTNLNLTGFLPTSARIALGANKDNLVGLLTSHVVHESSSHLVQNLGFALMLIFLAILLESKDEKFRGINVLRWIILPVILVDALMVLYYAVVNMFFPYVNPYAVGLSLLAMYLLGFMLVIGWKRIRNIACSGVKKYLDIFNPHKQVQRLTIHQVLFSIVFALSIIIFALSFWAIISAFVTKSSIQTMTSEFAHVMGLLAGILFGAYWLKNSHNPGIS